MSSNFSIAFVYTFQEINMNIVEISVKLSKFSYNKKVFPPPVYGDNMVNNYDCVRPRRKHRILYVAKESKWIWTCNAVAI